MDLDIAVVGGGVSGAYSAWRLQQAFPKKKIALFEYSDRIGGRLYTVTLSGLRICSFIQTLSLVCGSVAIGVVDRNGRALILNLLLEIHNTKASRKPKHNK